MGVLQVTVGPEPGRLYRLAQSKSVLGRHPDCDVYDCFLEVNAVSRRHAQILHEGAQFFVEDLRSRNGTLLNDQKISGRVPLRDGDRVNICDIEFRFYSDDEPPASSSQIVGAGNRDSSLAAAAQVVEDDARDNGSTIMSKIELTSSSRVATTLGVNAETKLRALVEMLANLGRSLELDDVLDHMLAGLFKIFPQADRGFVGLRIPETGAVVPRAVKHRRENSTETVRVSRTIVNQVLQTKQAILSADAASDSRFDMAQSIADFQIRSMMCAPLIDSDDNVLGIIQIDAVDQRSRFQHEDLDVLASVAPQAAFALQYAQLHESAMRQIAVERDLELARKVQRGLLPDMAPSLAGYQFFDFYAPAYQVGGDYFDYVPLSDGRLAMVVADVSGKGVSAALLMANLSGELKFNLAREASLVDAVARVNADVSRGGWTDHFVTMVLAVLDPARTEVTLVNAGHMAPLLRRGVGKVEPVGEEQAGLPLGVDAEYPYAEYRFPLAPGNSLTMFTDGFSEAMNPTDQLYGIDRLRKQLSGRASAVQELGEHILGDVKQFVRGRAQSDDMCLICFGREKG